VMLGQVTTLNAQNADWLALSVANDVLGNGFTSRLIGNVRDREGLTYTIGSRIAEDFTPAATWLVRTTFSPALLERGIAAAKREVNQWWEKGVTAEELEFRKTSMAGDFAVSLETTTGLAEQMLLCARRGFDLKWLDEYPAKLSTVTLEDVNRVIKAQLDPKKMVLVKAGVPK
jgi:zinc protease